MQPIMGAGTNDLRTLWIGDIEPWMNEKHVEDVFNKVGKLWDSLLNFFLIYILSTGRVISVKLIRSKETNLPAGKLNFESHIFSKP